MSAQDRIVEAVARAINIEKWGGDRDWENMKETSRDVCRDEARAALTAALPLLREEFARVADRLGGDRVERGRTYSNDSHGRTDQVINAQHVRAQSIAAAIRALDLGKEEG